MHFHSIDPYPTVEKNDFTVVKEDWQDDVEDDWDASSEEEVVIEKKPVMLAKKPAAPVKKEVEEPLETAQEKKLRLQKLQEAADLDNAVHLFGSDFIKAEDEPTGTTTAPAKVVEIDWLQSLDPQTAKDFDAISATLSKKLKSFEKSKFYVQFVESLTKSLLADREVPEIRKVGGIITDLAALKQREKLAAAKKPAPSLAGAKKSSRNDYADFDFDEDGDAFA